MSQRTQLLCPSAQPDWQGSILIGLLDAASPEPRIVPLAEPAPVTASLLALAHPIPPTEIMRFAAPCAGAACSHFSGDRCTLVVRAIAELRPDTAHLPYCRIRATCRWWAERGRPACLRCPQINTDGAPDTAAMQRIAAPPAAARATDLMEQQPSPAGRMA
jgi:hypothetical protein